MEAYIVAGYRSAVGKAKKGGFRFYRSDDLAVRVLEHLGKNVDFDTNLIDDVLVGCANPEGEQGLQIGRQISLRAFGKTVPGVTVNRYCASGLETISMAVAKIKAGMGDCYVAGGTESMSLIPMTGYKLSPSYEVGLNSPQYVVGMGLTAEAVANKYGISREAQDEFAYQSHMKAADAIDAGKFKDEIVPVQVTEVSVKDGKRTENQWTVDTDEGVRRSTTAEGLGGLRPVFAQGGSVTAGNSSPMSDGAAFVLVMSEKMVKDLGLEPIARMASCSVAGVDPLYMGMSLRSDSKSLAKSRLEIERH